MRSMSCPTYRLYFLTLGSPCSGAWWEVFSFKVRQLGVRIREAFIINFNQRSHSLPILPLAFLSQWGIITTLVVSGGL